LGRQAWAKPTQEGNKDECTHNMKLQHGFKS
jgi:hypothetical protein